MELKDHKAFFTFLFISFLIVTILMAVAGIQQQQVYRSRAEGLDSGPNSIGYIGCSNSKQTVAGYRTVTGNKNLFWPEYNTGGEDIIEWANPSSPAWREFDTNLARYSQTKYIWMQICEREDNPATYDTIKHVLSTLRQHTPPATIIYISPLNSYIPPNGCGKMGNDGVSDLVAFADQAAADGLARRGPDLGPLTTDQTSDDCHPTPDAQHTILGPQMVDFFDKGIVGQPRPTISPSIAPTRHPTSGPTPSGGGGGLPTAPNSLGYIGCSNTWQSVEGYHAVSGNKNILWPVYRIGGEDITQWADAGNDAWIDFNTEVRRFGQPTHVWIQVCVGVRAVATYDDLKQALSILRQHTSPTTVFYISPLNDFNPPGGCKLVGTQGIAPIVAMVDRAVGEGLGRRGPNLGPLSPDQTTDNGCHPNENARATILGPQLVNFFDKGQGGPPPPTGTLTRTPTPRPTTPTPTCTPRPACLDAHPRCEMPEPAGGFCPRPTVTSRPGTPTPTHPPVTPTRTPTPTSGGGGGGGTGQATLALTLSFQGITTKPTNASTMPVQVSLLARGAAQKATKTISFTAQDNGTWKGTVTFDNLSTSPTLYTLYVKGPKHVQKKVCEATPTETAPGTYRCGEGALTLHTGSNSMDLSHIKLLVGDLPDQNGIVDSYDISYIRNNLGKTDPAVLAIGDLNLDGRVDTQDYSLLIASLSVKYDEE